MVNLSVLGVSSHKQSVTTNQPLSQRRRTRGRRRSAQPDSELNTTIRKWQRPIFASKNRAIAQVCLEVQVGQIKSNIVIQQVVTGQMT